MNAVLEQALWTLARTTALMTVAAILLHAALRLLRVDSPRIHRAGWLAVLCVGWTFVGLPLDVPWRDTHLAAVQDNDIAPPNVDSAIAPDDVTGADAVVTPETADRDKQARARFRLG